MKQIKIITKYENNNWRYYGIDENDTILFQRTLIDTTQGITEFIACVHALMYAKKTKTDFHIYTSNAYIKQSIETKQYKHVAKNESTNEILKRAKRWLTFDASQTITINLIENNNDNGKSEQSELF